MTKRELHCICDVSAFDDWLLTTKPSIEYHRGSLAADRDRESQGEAMERVCAAIGAVGARALHAYEARMVNLVQKRHGPFDYSYIAQRRNR